MTRSVQEVDPRFLVFWEVVGIHFATYSSVHVLDANADAQIAGQRDDVDVVAFLIHGFHLLLAKLLHCAFPINKTGKEGLFPL